MSDQDKANRLKTLSLLMRMFREIENGYVPDFLSIAYPLAGESEVVKIIGFTSMKSALTLHTLLNEMDEDLQEEAVRRKTGLTSEIMNRAEDQFMRDMVAAASRLADTLTPDEPVTDLKDAQKILGKIMAKGKK